MLASVILWQVLKKYSEASSNCKGRSIWRCQTHIEEHPGWQECTTSLLQSALQFQYNARLWQSLFTSPCKALQVSLSCTTPLVWLGHLILLRQTFHLDLSQQNVHETEQRTLKPCPYRMPARVTSRRHSWLLLLQFPMTNYCYIQVLLLHSPSTTWSLLAAQMLILSCGFLGLASTAQRRIWMSRFRQMDDSSLEFQVALRTHLKSPWKLPWGEALLFDFPADCLSIQHIRWSESDIQADLQGNALQCEARDFEKSHVQGSWQCPCQWSCLGGHLWHDCWGLGRCCSQWWSFQETCDHYARVTTFLVPWHLQLIITQHSCI